MSISGRWRIRWDPSVKTWLAERLRHTTSTRRHRLRFTFDRRLQQIAQFPFSGTQCKAHYPDLVDISDAYRVAFVEDLVLIYFVDDAERMIVLVHLQVDVMDTPS